MKLTEILLATGLAVGMAAGCVSTTQQRTFTPPAPTRVEPSTPCDEVHPSEIRWHGDYKVMKGRVPDFLSRAVGIETGTLTVTQRTGPDGEARYSTRGVKPASAYLLQGSTRRKAERILENADRADGRVDNCITLEGIEVVMSDINRRHAEPAEPIHVRMRSESHSYSGNGKSGSYHRTETQREGENPRVEESITGNMSKDEITNGLGYRRTTQSSKTNRIPGTCGFDQRSGMGDCGFDFRTQGKSQAWLKRCIEPVQKTYDACMKRVADALYKCQNE